MRQKILILLSSFLLCTCGGCYSTKLGNILPPQHTGTIPQNSAKVPRYSYTPQPQLAPSHPSISPELELGDSANAIMIDPAYFDGAIILTQFFTLMDLGLKEEVSARMSSRMYKLNQGETDPNIESVKIEHLIPYSYHAAAMGWKLTTIPEDELRFSIGLTYYYKGASWNINGIPTPYYYTRFVSLVMENGDWKVDEINSSPWFPN